jgi:hypothetical protein
VAPDTDVSIITAAIGDRVAALRYATALDAVQRSGGDPPAEVIVVAPGPAGRELVGVMAERWGEVSPVTYTVLDAEPGTGFATAANVGVAKASGDVLVVTNLDVTLHQRFLRVLRREMENDGWHFLAPNIREGDDKRPVGATRRGRGHRLTALGGALPREPVSVEAGNGCCVVIRREALERRTAAVGALFEEAFESGSEDLDLFWWAEREGLQVRYVPDLQAGHAVVRKAYVDLFTNRSAEEQRRTMANYRVAVWRHASKPKDWIGWVVGEAGFLGEIAVAYKARGVLRYLSSWPQSVTVAQAIKRREGRLRT